MSDASIVFQVDRQTLDELRDLASEAHVSIADVVRQSIAQHLGFADERIRAIGEQEEE